MPWKLDPGLVDDFDFVCEHAEFGFQKGYVDSDGKPVCVLLLDGRSLTQNVELSQPVAISIGQGWAPVQGGAACEHITGKTSFVTNSHIGLFITRCATLVDKKVPGRTALDVLETRSPNEMRTAAPWFGLGFHLKREEQTYKNLRKKDSDEVQTSLKLLPTEFLGELGTAGASGAAPSAAPAGASAAIGASAITPPPAASTPPAMPREKVEEFLAAILAQSSDATTFAGLAMKVPGLSKHEDLYNAIMDFGPAGYYAKRKK